MPGVPSAGSGLLALGADVAVGAETGAGKEAGVDDEVAGGSEDGAGVMGLPEPEDITLVRSGGLEAG